MKYTLENIIEECRFCYCNEKYLASLILALSLPDYASKDFYNNNFSSQEKYSKWCDKFLGPYFYDMLPFMCTEYKEKFGNLIYKLRCSLSHSLMDDVSAFNPTIFKLKTFSLFVDKNHDFLKDSFRVENKMTSGYIVPKLNDYYVSINVGYLIYSIISACNNYYLEKYGKTDIDNFLEINEQ